MTARSALLGLIAVPLALAGCASGEATGQAAATTSAQSVVPTAEPPIESPPVAAQTPCSDVVRGQVQAVLGLESVRVPEAVWEDNRYTCTYQTEEGPLVYAVRVASTDAAAAGYLKTLRSQLRARTPLTGLREAYQNGLGTVVARHDNLVLSVDASALPLEHLGPDHHTQTGLAIILAIGVVNGWAGQA
jgi:hypothetical protein